MLLRVLTGAAAGRTLRLAGKRLVVGSDQGCDLVLPDRGVEPRHAVFERTSAGAWTLTDLGSREGTFVTTRRIRGRVELRGDEELCFGETFAQLSRTAASRRVGLGLLLGLSGFLLIAAAVAVLVLRGSSSDTETGQTVTETVVLESVPLGIETGTAEDATSDTEAPAETEAPADTETLPFAGGAEREFAVYRDDFSDPSSGWEVFDDAAASAGYDAGTFLVRINDPDVYATTDSGREFAGSTVTVVALNPSGTTETGFGIVCRYRGPDDFVILAASAAGLYAIAERDGRGLRILSGGGRWASSPEIPVGARRYRLKATCAGDVLRLAVNGRRIASVRSRVVSGSVGLFAAGGADIRFDDFVATGRTA